MKVEKGYRHYRGTDVEWQDSDYASYIESRLKSRHDEGAIERVGSEVDTLRRMVAKMFSALVEKGIMNTGDVKNILGSFGDNESWRIDGKVVNSWE